MALVFSTAGASVAGSAPLALQTSSADLALAQSQVSESVADTSALAERRTAVTDQTALLQGRQQEAERVAREKARLELEKKKAEEAAKAKAEAEAKKKAEEAQKKAEAERAAADARERAEEEARRSAQRYVAPINRYKYTSGFGSRWGRLHAGADLAAPIGTPVFSVSSGTVIKAAHTGSCGNNVWIEHWDGAVSRYCHLDYMAVGVGQRVSAGEQIGGSGNTGRSYGPHLHFEMRPSGENSDPVDPVGWLRSRGVGL